MHGSVCFSRRFVLACAVTATVLAGAVMTTLAQTPSTAGSSVTFTKDVAPILQRSCVTCHRTGESAPMSLMTYEDVRPWARDRKSVV